MKAWLDFSCVSNFYSLDSDRGKNYSIIEIHKLDAFTELSTMKVGNHREKSAPSDFVFLEPSAAFALPRSFKFDEYIETERELWALFPETDGRRVNFIQAGLTAHIYAEVPDQGTPLAIDETYILMPCGDQTMRPIRMQACRRLTLSEYRMGHLTAIKLVGKVNEAGSVMREIGARILGAEVMEEVQARLSEPSDDDF